MPEHENQETSKTDWSHVESLMRSGSGVEHQHQSDVSSYSSEQVPQLPANIPAPPAMAVTPVDINTPRGILMQFKRNQIDRKAALQSLQVHYDARLDVLKYQLQKAVLAANSRADLIAEEFLEKLNAEHLKVMDDLGIKNFAARTASLVQVKGMMAAKMAEIESKNWPQNLIDETIKEVIALGKRISGQMMKELGS